MADYVSEKKVSSFTPIQNLYAAVREYLAVHGDLNGNLELEDLREAADLLEVMADRSLELVAVHEAAQELVDEEILERDDVQIDTHNLTHHNGEPPESGEGGYWVGAWIWVSDASLEDR